MSDHVAPVDTTTSAEKSPVKVEDGRPVVPEEIPSDKAIVEPAPADAGDSMDSVESVDGESVESVDEAGDEAVDGNLDR